MKINNVIIGINLASSVLGFVLLCREYNLQTKQNKMEKAYLDAANEVLKKMSNSEKVE